MSTKKFLAKAILGTLAASAAVLTSVAPVSAHATVQLYGSTPTAGGYGHMFIRIPHGCEGGLATDTIKVQLPAGFSGVKPQAKAGWNVSVAKADGQPTEITWSNGSLADSQFDDFGISVKYPSAAGTYAIPTVQYCGSATAAWVEIPAAGQSSHSLAKPAPMVKVNEKSSGHGASMPAAKWTGDVEVSASGKKSAAIVVDASTTNRFKHAMINVVNNGVSKTIVKARLDSRGDFSRTVALKSSKYHIMEGSTIEVVVGGKTIASTTFGSAHGSSGSSH